MIRRQSLDHDLRNAYSSDFENRFIQSSYVHSQNHPDTFYPRQSQIPAEPSYNQVEDHTYDPGPRVDPEPPKLPQYKPAEVFEFRRRPDPSEQYEESIEFACEFWEEYTEKTNHDRMITAFEEDEHQSEEFWSNRQHDPQADWDNGSFELDPWDDDKFRSGNSDW